jgi:hypothetical protein
MFSCRDAEYLQAERKTLFNFDYWTFSDDFDLFPVEVQEEMSKLEKIKPKLTLDLKQEILSQFLWFFDLFLFFLGKSWLNLITGRFLMVWTDF